MKKKNKKTFNSIKKNIKNYCKKNFKVNFDFQKPSIKLHEPTFGHEEINSALDVLLSRNVTMGKKVKRFENSFAKKFDFKKSISCNSGSSANLLAIATLSNLHFKNKLMPGDEVIVSALSWSTTIWPLIQYGLIPVVVDINLKTLNIDENQILDAISDKTKAIMPVHVYGNPCNMESISKIAKQKNLFIIEDCCEAMGAKFDNKYVGSFGEVGAFSFYFSHHITTLEGGMCVTNKVGLSERMKIIRAHGWLRDVDNAEKFYDKNLAIDKNFTFVDLGYNLRITELQGAFGLEQIKKFTGLIKKREKVFLRWKKILKKYSSYFITQKILEKGKSSYFGFPITIKEKSPFNVLQIREYFRINGIETRPIICGNICLQPAFKHYPHRIYKNLSKATYVMKNSFSVGCHQNVSKESQKYFNVILHKFLNKYK